VNAIFRKQLSRRTVLRGVCATVALPLLDTMIPALARADSVKSSAPSRIAFVYFPNGVQMSAWAPVTEGDAAKLPDALPRCLEPLAPFRDDISVLRGLTVNSGRALGDGSGDHGRAGASYLTGTHPKKTFGKDIQAGVSIDQFAAQKFQSETRFASLEVGCEEGIQGGNCDNGYSCAYSNSISWRTPSSPMPPEVRPRAVFERLFGSADLEPDPVRRARLEKYDRSILDSVLEDARRLTGNLGASDRRKLDEYMFSIRDIEKRIQGVEKKNASSPMPAPASGVPEDFRDHSKLMFDLMTVAFQTDTTRVSTFLMAVEQSNRAYREIGIADSHHGLTHHGGDKEKIEKCIQINRFQVEQFAYFLGKLKLTPDGDGSLLDHVAITYGSGLSIYHDHDDLPTVLAGHARGAFHPGRHLRYPVETPLSNLHLSMLATVGVDIPTFGEGTGKLEGL